MPGFFVRADEPATLLRHNAVAYGAGVTISGGMRSLAHVAIRFYQLTFSALVGRQCRHLPTCSDYTDEAISRHGLWAGGWMGAARICRCHPFGTSGFDPVPAMPSAARWYAPWRYGVWSHRALSDGVPDEPER